MAYTLDNLRTDIRNYTEVGSNVLSDTVLERLIKNAELKIHRAIDTDQSVFYATSNLIINILIFLNKIYRIINELFKILPKT